MFLFVIDVECKADTSKKWFCYIDKIITLLQAFNKNVLIKNQIPTTATGSQLIIIQIFINFQ